MRLIQPSIGLLHPFRRACLIGSPVTALKMNQKGMLQASQVVCLLLAFSKCTLASNSWLTPDHTQLVTAQSSLLHQVGLCSDSRCSCGYSLHGTINITCQCSPQDQVCIHVIATTTKKITRHHMMYLLFWYVES